MAYIQMNFYSDKLKRNVSANAWIPIDISEKQRAESPYYHKKNMKALYLLHGYSGDCQDWMFHLNLNELSKNYNLAIICPCGENSFYLDRKATGFAYGEYIGEELVAYTRRLFGLSNKKEDTFIGGYSMGGFGALRNGLKYHETFSKIIALSSALITHDLEGKDFKLNDGIANYEYYTSIFGDLSTVMYSDKNPEFIILSLQEKKIQIPEIFMACGMEDFLLDSNRRFAKFLDDKQVPVIYKEASGNHNWDFWNQYFEQGIQWLLNKPEH